MTPLLTVAVLLVGALCVLNLILTVGVVRRLREHTETIERLSQPWQPENLMVRPGDTVGSFTVRTEDGDEVSREGLTGETLVAVLSPDCPACSEQLPHFLEAARSHPRGRQGVLAVVVGDPEGAASHVERLAPVARVVVEAEDGSVGTALRVRGFPSFARLDGSGRVLSSGFLASDLENPVAA